MVLPFVRDVFADVEKIPAFTRAASHLKARTGRSSVSGLTPTAKTLLLVLLQRAVEHPIVLVVSDNRAAEDMVTVLQGFAELTGAVDPQTIVSVPARDVLPWRGWRCTPDRRR